MDFSAVRNEFRKRVVEATGIDPVKQLQLQGRFFPENKKIPFWVQEYTAGGEANVFTNIRNSCNSFIMQYNFVCRTGNGTDLIEAAAEAAANAIPPGSSFNVNTMNVNVNSVKISQSGNEKFASVEVAFVAQIVQC